MTFVAVFWLFGLACLLAVLAGKEVKIGNVELPAFSARSTRIGATGIGIVALLLGSVLFFNWEIRENTPPGIGQGTPTTPGLQTAAPGSTLSSTDPAVAWHGTMTLADGRGVHVGNESPSVGGISSSSFYLFTGYVTGGVNALSKWTADTAPGATDCVTQLRTHPIDQLRLQVGLQFCTMTS